MSNDNRKKLMLTEFCPLCASGSTHYYADKQRGKQFYQCQVCSLIFLHPDLYLSPDEEKKVYLQHQNNIHDPGYQKFVSPLVQFATDHYSAESLGLDYGSGTGPVITHLLNQQGYTVKQYDPYFHCDPSALEINYDYILVCEVAEHFYHPDQEFTRFKNLLRPNGSLVISTSLYSDEINFENWHYHLDPTHVMLYQLKTFEWIRDAYNFSSLKKLSNRLVVLSS